MLISVVIPVFNVVPQLLERSLGSVICHNDEDVEVVVIDDGSEYEKSLQYEAICNAVDNVRYFRKENAGPSSSRNTGVERANGEYILFLDVDDYLTDTCIKQAKRIVTHSHPDIVFGYVHKDLHDDGSVRFISNDTHPKTFMIRDEKRMSVLMNHILGYESSRLVFANGYVSDGPVCRFFRRKLFLETPFDVIPRWNEDTLWNIELLRKCRTAVICKSTWYVYAVREGSTMQGYRDKCYDEFLYITRKVSEVGEYRWKGMIRKGISCRVWHDIFILSRALIFNQNYKASLSARYKIFKNAVKCQSYQTALASVDFHYEHRGGRRIMKQILKTTMRIHLYPISYLIVKVYLNARG